MAKIVITESVPTEAVPGETITINATITNDAPEGRFMEVTKFTKDVSGEYVSHEYPVFKEFMPGESVAITISEIMTDTALKIELQAVPYAQQQVVLDEVDTRTWNISPDAPQVQEGFLEIISMVASPETAKPGQTVRFIGQVMNTGGEDTVSLNLTDADTNEVIGEWTSVLVTNDTYEFQFEGTMPNRNWNLVLRSGHEE